MNPELLAEIHAKSFITPRPWSALEFDELLIKDSIFLISEKRSFLLGMLTRFEAEILTIAVDPINRRIGIAEKLLNEFELTLGVEINVPNRMDGEFKCLTKDKIKNIRQIMKLANIEYFEDPDIQENFKFFHELVKDLKVLSVEDGLSNIEFKFLNEKKYKNAKIIEVAL